MKKLILSFSLFFVSLYVEAYSLKKISNCDVNKYQQLFEERSEIQKINFLPGGLYMARDLKVLVEENGVAKFGAHRILKHSQEKQAEICYLNQHDKKVKVEGIVPVLIDLTQEKSGHSYWSVSMTLEKQVGGISLGRSLQKSEDFLMSLEKQGFRVEKSQISHDEFEIRLERKKQSISEKIVLIFDRVS